MDSRDSRQALEDLACQKGGLPSAVTGSTVYKITRKEPCKLSGVPEHRHSAKLRSRSRTARICKTLLSACLQSGRFPKTPGYTEKGLDHPGG